MIKMVVTFDDNVTEFLINEEGNLEGIDETVDEEVYDALRVMYAAGCAEEFNAKEVIDALERARGNHKLLRISLEVVS